MRAQVETVDGLFELDLDEEDVLDFDPDGALPRYEPLELPFPGVVAADASGSTMVAVVGRRPPLVVSYDAGVTWTETGGGLPARNRRRDRADRSRPRALRRPQPALPVPRRRTLLDEPRAGAAGDPGRGRYGSLNCPRATTTAEPPTATRSTCSADPSTRAWSVDGRPISTPCVISISSPKEIRP